MARDVIRMARDVIRMASHTSLHPLILYKGKVGGNESRHLCCFPLRLEPTQNANPTKMMQIRHKSYTNPMQIPCKSRVKPAQTWRKPHTHPARRLLKRVHCLFKMRYRSHIGYKASLCTGGKSELQLVPV